MTRTDVHRPVNLTTEDYEFLRCFDTKPPEPPAIAPGVMIDISWWIEMRDAWVAEYRELRALVSSSPLSERGLTQCHHCGARLRYAAVLRHLPTGDHIVVGETCLDNRFSLASDTFQRLRKAAALDAERRRVAETAAAFLAGLPDVAQKALTPGADLVEISCGDDWTLSTLTDIREKMWRYGDLSERQVAFVIRLVEGAAKKAEEKAARAAEIETPAPTGRVTFEGVVVKTDWRYNDFNGGDVKKLTVKVTTDAGVWLVWLTCPSAILDVRSGQTVRMTATLTPSNDKPHFAFGKRPAKAEIVAPAGDTTSLD